MINLNHQYVHRRENEDTSPWEQGPIGAIIYEDIDKKLTRNK